MTITVLWLIPALLVSPRVQALLRAAGLEWLLGSGAFLAFALLILVFALQKGLISKLLNHPLPVLLGEISFSLYLVHMTVLRYYRYNLAAFSGFPLSLLALFYWLISLLLAYLIYTAIEMPCRMFLVRLPDLIGQGQSVFSVLHLRMKPALSLLLLGVFASAGFYQPSTLKILNEESVSREVHGEELMRTSARFGNGLELKQLFKQDMDDRMIFTFLWYVSKDMPLKESVGFHFLDRYGKIIHQADYDINPGGAKIIADSYFVSKISVSRSKIDSVAKLGIALYLTAAELYPVTAQSTDWGGRRIIISL